jgi:metallophosphoesterase (TIGR00282 family)
MRIAFIGDIVGRSGREMIRDHISNLRDIYSLDLIIANGENASAGFGVTTKNAKELFSYGLDLLTGGNHSFDKKDIIKELDNLPIIRPLNYPKEVEGRGYYIFEVNSTKVAIISLMGIYGMPHTNNPFRDILELVDTLHSQNIENIFVDFHAESTAEKETLLQLLHSKVTGIVGTHTHVGTDDLKILNGTGYVSDIGLTGCRDGVLGMDKAIPIKRALTSIGGHFEVPKKCKKIMQLIIIEFEDGLCNNAFKVKQFDSKDSFVSATAFKEID